MDELYAQSIASELRDRGHDVISVHERSDLEGLQDSDLFQAIIGEHRALLTENWADFKREMEKAAAAGQDHYGVVFTSRGRMPRGKNTIGLYVRVLDDFLERHPDEDALLNSSRWLPEPGREDLLE